VLASKSARGCIRPGPCGDHRERKMRDLGCCLSLCPRSTGVKAPPFLQAGPPNGGHRPRAAQATGWSASQTPTCTRTRRRPCSRWWSARRSRAWPRASAPPGPPRTTGSSCRAAPSARCTVRRRPEPVPRRAACAGRPAPGAVGVGRARPSAALRMAAHGSPA